MAEFSAPFSTSPLATEYQWSRLFRNAVVDGVIADDTSSPSLRVSASGTDTVVVAPGEAYVNGFYYSNDAPLRVPVTPNAGSAMARMDLVVLRCDQAGNAVSARYKAGGTSPPPLAVDETGVYEIPLAQTRVAAGATSVAAGDVTDQRWFVGPPVTFGSPHARRPSCRGQLLVEGREIYLGNGSGWEYVATAGAPGWSSYTPAWSAGNTAINWGSGTVNLGRYKLIGKTCHMSLQLIPTGNPAGIDAPMQVSLPVPCHSAMRQLFIWNFSSSNGEGSAVGVGFTAPTQSLTKIDRLRFPTSDGSTSSTVPNSFSMYNNFPFNIRNGDILTISGTYEAA